MTTDREWFLGLVKGTTRVSGLAQDPVLAEFGTSGIEHDQSSEIMYEVLSELSEPVVPLTRKDADYTKVVYVMSASEPMRVDGYQLFNISEYEVTVRKDSYSDLISTVTSIGELVSENAQTAITRVDIEYVHETQKMEANIMVDVLTLPLPNQSLPACLIWLNQVSAGPNAYQNTVRQTVNRRWKMAILGEKEDRSVSTAVRGRLLGKQQTDLHGQLTYSNGNLIAEDNSADIRVWTDEYDDWMLIYAD